MQIINQDSETEIKTNWAEDEAESPTSPSKLLFANNDDGGAKKVSSLDNIT